MEFTEHNHVIKNPESLLKKLKEDLVFENDLLFSKLIFSFTIIKRSSETAGENLILDSNYWIRKDEYQIMLKRLKGCNIQGMKELVLGYTLGNTVYETTVLINK